MTDITSKSVELFQKLERDLNSSQPESIKEAIRLSESIIDLSKASKSDVWEKLWEKPLFSNRKTYWSLEAVETYKNVFLPNLKEMDPNGAKFGATRKLVSNNNKRGSSIPKYEFTGTCVKKIQTWDKFRPRKIHAIINAGHWLNNQTKESIFELSELPIDICVRKLEKELGYEWGLITVMHFLTDCGLCCKPDIHVTATCKHIGIIALDSDPENNDKDALMLNTSVRNLANELHPNPSPKQFRYLDKVLMEISRTGLIS